MTDNNSHLDAPENHSVFIRREANYGFKNMAMPRRIRKSSETRASSPRRNPWVRSSMRSFRACG